ncbi:uncharacterized protein [Antedon mediterranea]|uniref:uncharacterized protein n=1 Tax=Antedon mediterranea TaxID=105859 RepID=UPI003AF9F5E0
MKLRSRSRNCQGSDRTTYCTISNRAKSEVEHSSVCVNSDCEVLQIQHSCRKRKTTRKLHCHSVNPKKKKNDEYFQFNNLPVICQLNVFRFLNDIEKCQVATVCVAWAKVIRSSCLWKKADFTQIPAPKFMFQNLCPQQKFGTEDLLNGLLEEMSYDYIYSLISRKACLRYIKFKFDIIEKEGIWLKLLEKWLKETNSVGLRILDCDWSHTVFCKEYVRATAWFNKKPRPNLKQERTLCFQQFLTILHQTSPHMISIFSPFDWSMASVDCIVQFECLRELKLTRYWALRGMEQKELAVLLQGLHHLEKLTIEVSIPIQLKDHNFKVASKSLKYLDIQECMGFYLSEVDLPKLEVFKDFKFYIGPIIWCESLNVKCLLEVLRRGAPLLKMINDLKLLPTWKCSLPYEGLLQELNKACFCSIHTHSSIIY